MLTIAVKLKGLFPRYETFDDNGLYLSNIYQRFGIYLASSLIGLSALKVFSFSLHEPIFDLNHKYLQIGFASQSDYPILSASLKLTKSLPIFYFKN